jgi:hypothetical protein
MPLVCKFGNEVVYLLPHEWSWHGAFLNNEIAVLYFMTYSESMKYDEPCYNAVLLKLLAYYFWG